MIHFMFLFLCFLTFYLHFLVCSAKLMVGSYFGVNLNKKDSIFSSFDIIYYLQEALLLSPWILLVSREATLSRCSVYPCRMSFRAARVRRGFLEAWFLLLGRTARLCSATAEVSLKSQSDKEVYDGKVIKTSFDWLFVSPRQTIIHMCTTVLQNVQHNPRNAGLLNQHAFYQCFIYT